LVELLKATQRFQRGPSRSVIDEEREDSRGGSRKRPRSNARWRDRQIFASPMAAQTKSRKEFRNGRVREDEGADRRGAALWRSAFMSFVETFAAYAASMHPTTAFSVEAALIAAKRLYPWPASRTPIAAEHERGPHLISRHGNVVELERVAAFPAKRSPELVELVTRKHSRET
jgi:hypothetical protein